MMIRAIQGILRSIISVWATMALVSGCTTTGSGSSAPEYTIGPGSAAGKLQSSSPSVESSGLSVLVPIMDPNIPEDSDEYKKAGIWPELRRAEANRFAVQLRNSLAKTNAFESVRVSPDRSATGHLYVNSEILQSNGEDVGIKVSVVDITGKKLLSRTYKHRVKEYDLQDPRSAGADLYKPIFDDAAEDIAKLASKTKSNRISTLRAIEEIRFAEAFSPEYFSGYIKTSRRGRTTLVTQPSDDDPMLQRIRALRVRDQMLIDNLQGDFNKFSIQMDGDYLAWQRQAYVESNAARKARTKANSKIFLGILAAAAGAAMAANSSPYGNGAYGGVAVATIGVAAIVSGVSDSKDAKAHTDSLNELGKSLNIQLAPRVMEMEGKTVELEGTASEQYQAWRSFLREFFVQEATPDVAL